MLFSALKVKTDRFNTLIPQHLINSKNNHELSRELFETDLDLVKNVKLPS